MVCNMEKPRIFINTYSSDKNWIIGKIIDDIQQSATALGLICRVGGSDDYQGEEYYYHMVPVLSIPEPRAKHNSVFFTHVNTKLGEYSLIKMKDKFDSFICMSEEDVEFYIELGFDPKKVYGKTLPVRNTYIKPISIGIFSACYEDGRKNEQWLVDFCKEKEKAKLVNFVFIGKGWDKVVKELEQSGCSFEWHNVSRTLPYEYQFQQNKLSGLNYYIYMGMDGGAMGTYDAYAQDVPLCVTYDGFHKSIPDIDFKFDNKDTFYEQLDKIVNKQYDRLLFFQSNDKESYTKWLINVWSGNQSHEISQEAKECLSYSNVLEKKRDQYYKLSFLRIKNAIRFNLRRILAERKMKNKNGNT